ncbi:hypothetical protein ACIPSE_46650 [Streptomyces sp. NPDC090106]|uniref:hypothetical protein n=1 Tax=Streptomyces sp. NPDC090106 TaxID=3365946 RepID=UPI00380BEDB9
MSDQPAPGDAAVRQRLDAETADALRALAAQARTRADAYAAVLEDLAVNGLPDPADCTPWEELREAHRARLAGQRPAVA